MVRSGQKSIQSHCKIICQPRDGLCSGQLPSLFFLPFFLSHPPPNSHQVNFSFAVSLSFFFSFLTFLSFFRALKQSVEFVISKKNEIDYDSIILFGHSCGAHMASLLLLSGFILFVCLLFFFFLFFSFPFFSFLFFFLFF